MPIGSPSSDKYVVYTLDNEDTCSSSGLEDGQIVFHDPEHVSLQDKEPKRNGNGRLRSISYDNSSHMGHKVSIRRKCCCLWNTVIFVALIALIIVLVITYKDYQNLKSSLSNENRTLGLYEATTTSTALSTASDIRKICETTDCIHQAASVLSRMNTNVNPCEDFYEFACGGFNHQSHLSWESQRVREVPDVLREKYGHYLEDALSSPILLNDPTSTRTVKSFYRDCKDQKDTLATAREKLRHLLVSLQNNNGINMKNDTKSYITRLLAVVMKNYGATPFFKVIVKKNGDITITNRYSNDLVVELFNHGLEIPSFRHLMPADFYFRYPSTDKVMNGYESFLSEALVSVFGNVTYSPDVDALLHSTSEVYEFEYSLNQVWYSDGGVNYSEEISFCKNRMSLSTLQRLHGGYNINWILFFSILLDKNVDENFEICHADLVSDISSVISEAKLELIRHYILTHTFLNTDLYKYVYRNFPKFLKSTSVYKSKESESNISYCISFLSKYFPLSSIFISNQSSQFETVSNKLFLDIKDMLVKTIQGLYWIPELQRRDIITHAQRVNLSFSWHESVFHDLTYVPNDFAENILGAIENKNRAEMKGHFIVSPFEERVSSFNSWNRELDISSLSLQNPIFYNSSEKTIQFGSVGGLISQALAEVLDLKVLLSHFLSGTIDQSVAYTLAEHFQCLVDFYNSYKYVNDRGETIHVRGDLTKSSNFRDILSLHLAQKTFQQSLPFSKVPELPGVNYTSSQVFYISYAQLFCEKITPKGLQQYYVNNEESNTPVPNVFRIQGAMSNIRAFSEAFKCPLNSPMNPENKCPIF